LPIKRVVFGFTVMMRACQLAFRARRSEKILEQQSDILQWDQSNKNYIFAHDVSGVDWRFYKNPRPEPVYDIYMQYWGDVEISANMS
jgi:hypothetical protein